MFSKNKTKNISIPAHQEENVRRYLSLLSMQDKNMEIEGGEEGEEEAKEGEIIEESFEVKKVLNHRINNGNFEFLLCEKPGIFEWVADSNCSCEWLISKYLEKHNIKTFYLFCRVSTKEQAGQHNVSLDAQEQELRQSIVQNKNTRIKVIRISKSAYKDIPKEFIEIGEVCKKGDSILIYRVDRLSRNVVTFLSWLEDLNNREVDIYSLSEKLSFSKNKLDFIQAIVNAQKESALIGERIKMAFKRKKNRGDERVGRLPYGKKYKRLQNNTMIIEDNSDEQWIINIIKNNKNKIPKIVEQLNNLGIKKNGRPWNANMVRRIKKCF